MTQSSEHTLGDQDDAAYRVASGIAGLDTILSGGFLAGGIYIVQGQPGAGKTIFGNQLCFNHARAGGRALYVTLLAENHSRMLMHIGGLSFYAEELVPERVYYVSAFPQLERNGIRGLIDLIRREVRARDVNLLVLDGLVAAEDTAGSDLAIKKFIHELQAQAAVQGCTMFLLTSSGATFVTPEHTMVDGVIALESRLYGWRAERDLQIVKRRGGGFLRGRHAYRITDDGIRVFPRIESLYADPERSETIASEPLASGIPELDGMIGGGLPQQSTTLLIGPPGCGKTLLARATAGECHAKFFNVQISDVLDMYFGESERKLHEIFEQARAAAPAVLFFDEIEALAAKRQGQRDGMASKLVSQFLSELDGFADQNKGVLVLGATNVPWALDAAFRRPGRFDRVVFVSPPDREARRDILRGLLKDRPGGEGINVDPVVEKTGGFSGADLAHLVESAVDEAIDASMTRGEEVPLQQAHLEAALKTLKPTTLEWLTMARNYARYANEGGQYDDVLDFIRKHGK
jgi:KaiC/GvpD/RAD55 family RecA-like ATPase